MAGPWAETLAFRLSAREAVMPLRSRLRVWLESAMTEDWRAHRDLEVLNESPSRDGVR